MRQHPADRPRYPHLLPLGGGPKHRENELCSPARRAFSKLLAECTVPGSAASLVHKLTSCIFPALQGTYVLIL